jgi:hypothetical protein
MEEGVPLLPMFLLLPLPLFLVEELRKGPLYYLVPPSTTPSDPGGGMEEGVPVILYYLCISLIPLSYPTVLCEGMEKGDPELPCSSVYLSPSFWWSNGGKGPCITLILHLPLPLFLVEQWRKGPVLPL